MAHLPQGWIWDPFRTLDLLDLPPTHENFTCIGITKKWKKPRCLWSIDADQSKGAEFILRLMALNHPATVLSGDLLAKLAGHLLCSEQHKSCQVNTKVKEFSRKIDFVVAELKERGNLLSRIQALEKLLVEEKENAPLMLKAELSSTSTTLKLVQRQLEEQQQDSSTLRNDLEVAQNHLRETQSSMKSRISEFQDSLAGKEAEHQQLVTAQRQLEKQQQESSTLRIDLEVAQNDLRDAKFSLNHSRLSETLANLAVKSAELQEFVTIQRQLEEQKQESSILRNNLKVAQNDLRETQSFTKSKISKLQDNLKAKNIQLREDLADKQIELRNLDTSLSLRISNIQDDLAAKQDELQNLDTSTSSRIFNLQHSLAAKQTELQHLDTSTASTISALQDDLTAKQDELHNLDTSTSARISDLEQVSAEKEAEVQNTRHELKETKESVQKLQSSSSSTIDALQLDLAAFKSQIQQCEDQLGEKQKDLEALKSSNKSQVQELSQGIEESKIRETWLSEERATLQTKLKEAENKIEEYNVSLV